MITFSLKKKNGKILFERHGYNSFIPFKCSDGNIKIRISYNCTQIPLRLDRLTVRECVCGSVGECVRGLIIAAPTPVCE